MKNKSFKKIIAYLLVGAMMISTPMAASATTISDAYGISADDTADKSNENQMIRVMINQMIRVMTNRMRRQVLAEILLKMRLLRAVN